MLENGSVGEWKHRGMEVKGRGVLGIRSVGEWKCWGGEV